MSITSTSFKEWYDKYFSIVYLFLKGYLIKHQIPFSEKEIEDLVQNTFLSLLERKIDTPIEYPLAYLKKVAVSQVRIYYQQKDRVSFKNVSNYFIENIPDYLKTSKMEKVEEEEQIQGLLRSILNHLESRIVFKRIVQGYSYKEIARQENISNEKHLHVLYYRAKLKLFNYFKDTK